jgi:hypothetical protein
MHHVAHVGEPVGNIHAVFAALIKSGLKRIKRELDSVLAGYKRLHVFLRERVVQYIFMRRFRKLLAGVFIQRGLGIEGLNVTYAAEHEQPDHPLGFGLEMRLAVRQSPIVFGGSSPLRQ